MSEFSQDDIGLRLRQPILSAVPKFSEVIHERSFVFFDTRLPALLLPEIAIDGVRIDINLGPAAFAIDNIR